MTLTMTHSHQTGGPLLPSAGERRRSPCPGQASGGIFVPTTSIHTAVGQSQGSAPVRVARGGASRGLVPAAEAPGTRGVVGRCRLGDKMSPQGCGSALGSQAAPHSLAPNTHYLASF